MAYGNTGRRNLSWCLYRFMNIDIIIITAILITAVVMFTA